MNSCISMCGLCALALSACLLAPSQAQTTARFYVATEVGAQLAPEVIVHNLSNDRASICDEYINPLYASLPQCVVATRGQGDDWRVQYDASRGVVASASVGYHLAHWLRADLEYLFAHAKYAQSVPILGSEGASEGASKDKLSQEIWNARERLGPVTSNNLFVNIYVDWRRQNIRYVPYVGFGVGLAAVDVQYLSVWARNPDADAISTGEGEPNAAQIRENLAGTVSVGETELNDVVLGFQALLGVDYLLSETVSLGFKARWVTYGAFAAGGLVWDPLRSHGPNLRRDGSEPVSGDVTTSDLSLIGIGVGVKYHF